MMRVFLYMLVLSVWFCGVQSAELVFEGNPPENRRAVELLGKSERADVDSLEALLVNQGYLDGSARKQRDTIYVRAGDIYTIESILWANDSSLQSGGGLAFTQRNTEELIFQKVEAYRDAGYLYASAAIVDVSRGDRAVNLTAQLNTGPMLTLGEVRFAGVQRTHPELLSRYIAIDSGLALTKENLALVERRAETIQFIDFEPPLKVRPRSGYTVGDLELTFKEKKQVLFSGGGGLVPDGSSTVVWNLDLRFQNILGGGRLVYIKSEKKEKGNQLLEIAYRQPIFVLGVGEAGLNVATRDYRDLFYEFALKASYRMTLSRFLSAGMELGWRNVEPADDRQSYSAVHSAFSIERITLDNVLNPSSGIHMISTISFGYRQYDRDSLREESERRSFNETRASVGVQWNQRVKGRVVGQVRLNYTGLETGESLPPISELYFIGGPGSLRGYRNEQFTAVRAAYGSVEPRMRFDGGNLFVFGDAAYINNRVRDTGGQAITDEFYRFSYGVGATIVNRERLLKISVGWNPEARFDEPRLSLEFSTDI